MTASGQVVRFDWTLLALVALTAVAFGLRIRGFAEGLYGDELYTLGELRDRSLGGVLAALVNGTAPGTPL